VQTPTGTHLRDQRADAGGVAFSVDAAGDANLVLVKQRAQERGKSASGADIPLHTTNQK
jgi:hypothetical protein